MSDIAKLRWQCRRGMLELDVMLIPFLENEYENLNDEKQALFRSLLEEADPDLFCWLMGHGEHQKTEMQKMIEMIRTKAREG